MKGRSRIAGLIRHHSLNMTVRVSRNEKYLENLVISFFPRLSWRTSSPDPNFDVSPFQGPPSAYPYCDFLLWLLRLARSYIDESGLSRSHLCPSNITRKLEAGTEHSLFRCHISDIRDRDFSFDIPITRSHLATKQFRNLPTYLLPFILVVARFCGKAIHVHCG